MTVTALRRSDFNPNQVCTCGFCEPDPSVVIPAAPVAGSRLIQHRTIHIVDFENLVGSADAPVLHARAAWASYRAALAVNADDHVIIGLSRHAAAKYMAALPLKQVRLVVGRPGPDSADWALLNAMDVEYDATRFSAVAIASGDGIFTDLAAQFRTRGLPVWNVTSSLSGASRRLARVCSGHVLLKLGARVDRGMVA